MHVHTLDITEQLSEIGLQTSMDSDNTATSPCLHRGSYFCSCFATLSMSVAADRWITLCAVQVDRQFIWSLQEFHHVDVVITTVLTIQRWVQACRTQKHLAQVFCLYFACLHHHRLQNQQSSELKETFDMFWFSFMFLIGEIDLRSGSNSCSFATP